MGEIEDTSQRAAELCRHMLTVGGLPRCETEPIQLSALVASEACFTMLGHALHDLGEVRQRARVVFEPGPNLATHDARRNERREAIDRPGKRGIGRHEASAGEGGVGDGHERFDTGGMRVEPGRPLAFGRACLREEPGEPGGRRRHVCFGPRRVFGGQRRGPGATPRLVGRHAREWLRLQQMHQQHRTALIVSRPREQ